MRFGHLGYACVPRICTQETFGYDYCLVYVIHNRYVMVCGTWNVLIYVYNVNKHT